MKNTFNKDNAASTILLTAMFTLIAAAAINSGSAEAKADNAVAQPVVETNVETIVVTATRLK